MTDAAPTPEQETASRPRRNLLHGFRTSFVAGVVVVAPVGLTIWLIYWFVSGPLADIDAFVKQAIPEWGRIQAIGKAIPGLGVLIAIISIWFIGEATKNILGRAAVRAGERIFESLPVVRSLYKFFRNVFTSALQQSGSTFKEVALIPYPRPGLWALAFVIGEARGEIKNMLGAHIADPVGVFVPTVPNPTSGFLIYVSRAEMMPLEMSIEDAAKFVFSLGIVVPDEADGAAAAKKLEAMAAAASRKSKPMTSRVM